MIVRSLRLRLFALGVIAIAATLWVGWHVMRKTFSHYSEQRVAEALIGEGTALITDARPTADGLFEVGTEALDGRFGRKASGLYWQITGPTGRSGSRSLDGRTLAPPTPPAADGWAHGEVPGPFEEDLVAVARRTSIGGRPVLVEVAEDDEPLDRARAQFADRMAWMLAALGAALAAASWLQIHLGLRPLRRVSADVTGMQRYPSRRIGEGYPDEVADLVIAINRLADARQDDVTRARTRAADLAHALKTPLAALAAQNRLARAAGAEEAANGIAQALAAASAAVEAELARARAAAGRLDAGNASTRLVDLVERLFTVLARTEEGMNLVFDAEVPDELAVAVAIDDLAEILGNLLDNAVRHARRMIHVDAMRSGDRLVISIDDDGDGIAEADRARVLDRGVRLDQTGSGHGLGLSIAGDLIEATGGDLGLSESPSGGLRVAVSWPESIVRAADARGDAPSSSSRSGTSR